MDHSVVRWFSRGATTVAMLVASTLAWGQLDPDPLVEALHEPVAEHVVQGDLNAMVAAGQTFEAFILAFELGDELFEAEFNALDGGGANVGNGQRWTRIPRADLNGPGQWADHFPPRATGPNGQSCIGCHNTPFADGAGRADQNVHRDPTHSGDLGMMIQRNTPHIFGMGALQVLAEEMTAELHAIRDEAVSTAESTGVTQTRELLSKGTSYGVVRAVVVEEEGLDGDDYEVVVDLSGVMGVQHDLIVRPYQWKGSDLNARIFNRGACNNELGMQPVEFVGDQDGDFDGIINEITVGDLTALTIYLAAQPRPVTLLELEDAGLVAPLTDQERADINKGEMLFSTIGCASCHTPSMVANNPVFSEPSQYATHREAVFPSGDDPLALGLDPAVAVSYNMTTDLPDNLVVRPDGTEVHLGNFEATAQGGAIVRLYGDLKWHDLGAELAESIDETGSGASTFLTKELWGVADSGPYLHDGRASTLTEAILAHGGEGAASRGGFESLTTEDQACVIAFLNNLKLLLVEEEEGEAPAPDAPLLVISAGSDRANPMPLEGAIVPNRAYVFLGNDANVDRVTFWFNDPTMTSNPQRVENNAPFDFIGGDANGASQWWTGSFPDGQYTITALVEFLDGTELVTTSTFTID